MNFCAKGFFVIICLIGSNQLSAQALHPDSVVGEWICREATIIGDLKVSQDEKVAVETMRKGFENVRFIFGANGIFILQLSADAPAILKEMEFLNNQKWFYYPKQNQISIGTPQENLMHIRVEQLGGAVYFLIYETPLSLRMEKI